MSRYVAKSDVDWYPLDDGCLLFDRASDRYFALNATAAFIWGICDGELNTDAIAALATTSFAPPGEAADVAVQVHDTIATLLQEGLLHAHDE